MIVCEWLMEGVNHNILAGYKFGLWHLGERSEEFMEPYL